MLLASQQWQQSLLERSVNSEKRLIFRFRKSETPQRSSVLDVADGDDDDEYDADDDAVDDGQVFASVASYLGDMLCHRCCSCCCCCSRELSYVKFCALLNFYITTRRATGKIKAKGEEEEKKHELGIKKKRQQGVDKGGKGGAT